MNEDIAIHERDTIMINNKYCFLFGLGATTNFLNEVYRGEKGLIANIRGIAKTIKHALREPTSDSIFKGITGDIIVDGNQLQFSRVTGILAGTVESIAKGVAPLYDADKEDGTFHALITGLTPKQILLRIYFLLGIKIKHKNHFDGRVKSLVIKSEPFEYTMDGDIYFSDGSLELQVGPRIRLIRV